MVIIQNYKSIWVRFLRRIYNLRFSKQKHLARQIKNITGIAPCNLRLYYLAFTHSSTNQSTQFGSKYNYERLEYLGDAVIDLVIADLLFRKFPLESEGFLTEMRSKIVNASALNVFAVKLGIDELVQVETRNKHSLMTKNIFADVLEALIGAVYIDGGYQAAFRFIDRQIVKLYVDFDEIRNINNNFKSIVLEWSQKQSKTICFHLVDVKAVGPRKQFKVSLQIDGSEVSQGIDFTKKQAEQNAAQKFVESTMVSGGGALV